MKGVSIVIVCYNSSPRIEASLEYIKQQELPVGLKWEVVLINNNCSDDTVEVAKTKWGDFKIPLNIIDESNQGSAYARITGVRKAIYDYIIFCDDDNWLNKDYLAKVFCLLEGDKMIGAVGGTGIPVTKNIVQQPSWFLENLHCYACGKQSNETEYLTKKYYLWGAGTGARREALLRCYDHPILSLGRVGDTLTAGEDIESCMRLVIMGYKLYYDENLIYWHEISAHRLTEQYFKNLCNSLTQTYGMQVLYGELIENFVLQTISWKKLLARIYLDFKKKDFRFGVSRRLIYWKYGISFMRNNGDQKIIRTFFIQNRNIAGKL